MTYMLLLNCGLKLVEEIMVTRKPESNNNDINITYKPEMSVIKLMIPN